MFVIIIFDTFLEMNLLILLKLITETLWLILYMIIGIILLKSYILYQYYIIDINKDNILLKYTLLKFNL